MYNTLCSGVTNDGKTSYVLGHEAGRYLVRLTIACIKARMVIAQRAHALSPLTGFHIVAGLLRGATGCNPETQQQKHL